MSAGHSIDGGLHGVESCAQRVLRVQSTFHVADEEQGQAVAAKLIDRAHELANSPECECDVDVIVEWVELEELAAHPGGMASTDRSSAGERPAAR